MKQQTGGSSATSKRKSSSSVAKGATVIKCAYCDNIFSAPARAAVCLKCKRPANKPLVWPLVLLCLMLPPGGLLAAAWLRRSQPRASTQALIFSVVGAIAWGALYFLLLHK